MNFRLQTQLVTIFIFLLVVCGEEEIDAAPPKPVADLEEEKDPGPKEEVIEKDSLPVVRSNASFEVIIERDVVYAKGLSHNGPVHTREVLLKLDVYTPDNDREKRPVFVFFHGGAFFGGEKEQQQIIHLANYYASRGWVFISADYRLRGDNGTIPQEWSNYPATELHVGRGQFLAMYPAVRDAKAALRWMVSNAATYHIDPDYITIGGGSVGAMMAIAAAVSKPEDFRDEIGLDEDSTLNTTHMNHTFQAKTIINLWGSKVILDALEGIYGYQRFNEDIPPMLTIHGIADLTVPFSETEAVKAIYEQYEVPLAHYPIRWGGHGVWNAIVNGKHIEELSYDFIVEQQGLKVE